MKEECFGLFSLIYCMSHIPAGFITTIGLGLFNEQIYFITITATGVVAVLFTSFLIIDVEDLLKKKIEEDKMALEEPLNGDILAIAEEREEENDMPEQPPQEEPSLIEVFKYYPKMSSILWILVIDGFCYGIHIS